MKIKSTCNDGMRFELNCINTFIIVVVIAIIFLGQQPYCYYY